MRVEINYKEKQLQKIQTGGRQHAATQQWITEGIKEGLKKYIVIDENKSTMIQNLQDTAKANLKENFIATQPYFREKNLK